MNLNLFEGTQAIANIISALVGTALGLAGKILWDGRPGERFRSTDELIRRLKDNRLSSYGRDRLQKEAKQALTEWQKRSLPPIDSQKLSAWPSQGEIICARSLNSAEEGSSCPITAPAGVSPLFIQLSYSNKNRERHVSLPKSGEARRTATAAAVEQLRSHFDVLASSVKDSSELIAIAEWPKGQEPKLWISAPEFAIRSSSDVIALLHELSRAARLWIPGIMLVLEICLPQDVQQQLAASNKLVASEENQPSPTALTGQQESYGALYAMARNEVQGMLAQGVILGGLESPDNYSIPESILKARLASRLNIDELPSKLWTTLPVFGPPGSGKTETAGLIAKQFAESQKAIVIVCSTPELLADVEALADVNRETAFFSFAKDTCLSSDTLSARLREEEYAESFIDCFYELLCGGGVGQQIIIVVDDLQARREIRESLAKVRREAKAWGLHFILISRSRIEIFEQENDRKIELQCDQWERQAAEQILKSWVGKEREQVVDSALNEGWLAKRERFSIYLLRTIADNIDELGYEKDKPSALLEKAINRHLSSLSSEIRAKQSPAELLSRIESLLKRHEPHDTILAELQSERNPDFVTLLGILSWVSHFDHQDFLLDAKKIKDWSEGRISTESEATLLLDAGTKVGVFTKFRGAAMWHDKLISDGCAALYLGRQVETNVLTDALIGEMIARLEEATSVDILTLALDTPVLLRIIGAIANANPKLASVIPKLITSDFILQLKRNPEWLHGFWAHLWKHGAAVQVDQMQPFALVLEKLMALDEVLETRCRVALSEGHDSLLALTVLSVRFPHCSRLFDEVEKVAAYALPTAAEVAARYCRSDAPQDLLDKLIALEELGLRESESSRIWKLWCSRVKDVTVEVLLETVKRLLRDLDKTPTQIPLGRFANLCLEEAIGNRPPSQVIGHAEQIEELAQVIRELAKRGNPIGGKLIKWIALFYGSDLVERDGDWLIDKTGSFAIPRSPYDGLKIRQVFGRIASAYPRFQLAAAYEIKNLPRAEGATSELVRDHLPRKFSYNEAFLPSNCGVWNGALGYVSRGDVDSIVVSWRPRLNLEI